MATVASTILDPTLQNADAIEFETALNHKVVGQPEAAHKVTTAIQSFMAGLNDPARPIATFLLLGPTGTGKTRCLRPSGTKKPGARAPTTKQISYASSSQHPNLRWLLGRWNLTSSETGLWSPARACWSGCAGHGRRNRSKVHPIMARLSPFDPAPDLVSTEKRVRKAGTGLFCN